MRQLQRKHGAPIEILDRLATHPQHWILLVSYRAWNLSSLFASSGKIPRAEARSTLEMVRILL